MTKVYLVMRADCKNGYYDKDVVNVFTNEKKAETFKDWMNIVNESLYYVIESEIDTNDYSDFFINEVGL